MNKIVTHSGYSAAMTVVKTSPSKRLWVHFAQMPLVIAGIGAVAGIAAERISLGTGIVLFGLALLASIALNLYAMRTYSCPQCRRRLIAPRGWAHRYSGRPIYMRCLQCDVDWNFGLRGQEND